MSTNRRAATRGRLSDAARELLAEIGIQGATVEAICERAGFTRGAFYSNYGSKDELILELFDREKTVLVENLQKALDAELTSEAGLESVIRVVERFLGAYPSDRTSFLVHLEFVTHGIRGRAVAEVYREVWRGIQQEFARFIEHTLKVINYRLTVSVDQAAMVLLGAWEMAMRSAFLESEADEADLEPLIALLSRLIVAFLEPV